MLTCVQICLLLLFLLSQLYLLYSLLVNQGCFFSYSQMWTIFDVAQLGQDWLNFQAKATYEL